MRIFQFQGHQWRDYRAIRIEALSLHENVYGASFAQESAWEDAAWEKMLGEGNKAFFGLCNDGDEVIGCAAVFTDNADVSGKSALLAGAYVRAAYRGQGLSRALYQARLDWIRASGRFDKVNVGHREGNEASRRANQAFGFSFVKKVKKGWGDGSEGFLYIYELRIA